MSKALRLTLGTSLRSRREAMGWSQARLAEAVSVSPNYVGVLERGEKLPTLETLAVLADALGVSPAALLEEPAPAKDPWLEKIVAAARAIPPEHKPLALAIMRAAASVPASRKKQRPGKSRRTK